VSRLHRQQLAMMINVFRAY